MKANHNLQPAALAAGHIMVSPADLSAMLDEKLRAFFAPAL